MKTTRRSMIQATLATAATFVARPVLPAEPPPSAAPLRMQRLSWAGVRIETGEASIFIDPWTNKAAFDGDWPRPIVPITASTKRRAVLITHLHNDHFDAAAIKELFADGGQLFCLDSVAATVASKGITTRAAAVYQPQTFADAVMIAIPAADGFGDVQQVSWIVKAGGRTIIHCGDTIWHSGFDVTGRVYGPFDVAFMPINGAMIHGRPIDVDVPFTLTPLQAANAAALLRAKRIVPIHYGVSSAEYREQEAAVETVTKLATAKGIAVSAVAEGEWV
jgi:L-ascorbate metabolism protein UlaG (beta-lactamase superfamily)